MTESSKSTPKDHWFLSPLPAPTVAFRYTQVDAWTPPPFIDVTLADGRTVRYLHA